MMNSVRTFIEPIKKKWVYHFIVSPNTSSIEKPEWYLNQTLKWIHEHIDTVESELSSSSSDRSEIKQNFILCMIELAHKRLTMDMDKISNEVDNHIKYDAILIHTYNEVIQFTKVVRRLLGDKYSTISDSHDLLSVFCKQSLFEMIVDMEWEFAEKNFEAITSSDNGWESVLNAEFIDSYKIPQCADRILLLNKSITERVECFRQLDCQFKLIELQCYLFNKFLTHSKKTLESSPVRINFLSDMLFCNSQSTIDLTKILRVLNGVNFFRLILKEKYFIPASTSKDLDKTLLDQTNRLAADYKNYFYKLIERVVSIYEDINCDLEQFLEFISPKLANNVYEIIRDETSKVHERRKTNHLLKNLSSGGK